MCHLEIQILILEKFCGLYSGKRLQNITTAMYLWANNYQLLPIHFLFAWVSVKKKERYEQLFHWKKTGSKPALLSGLFHL